jgi:ABC-type Fe3+ transport system permease subunit
MSSRKRRRSPLKKHRLRNWLLLYTCLLFVPAILGGACGVVPYLVPQRKTFGRSGETSQPTTDKTAALKRNCLTGAAVGGVIGAGACVVVTWASRRKKRRLFDA